MLIESQNQKFIRIKSEQFHVDRNSLKNIIEMVEDRSLMVEVGSLAGFSTRLFSLYFDKVVSVDPYISGYDTTDMNSARQRLEIARDLFTIRFFDDPRVEQISKKSNQAAPMFEDNSIPFVYVDAGHNYEAVRDDLKCWVPKVKKGHFIAGDDYKWPGVNKAVVEVLPDHVVVQNRWIARI